MGNSVYWTGGQLKNFSINLRTIYCMCERSLLTIGGEEEVCGVLLRQPSDLIDLLLDLQTLKVVELGLMALKGAVDIILSLGEWLSLALWKEKGGK